ncbi:hypothetical protein ANN_20586 [Periplaneta americana]|uniref:Uncharacterized protein n=1 Tax=Periplaneta americana TaxID=6978 RepID=A0ABQ8SEC6_PERAM|nr:hypothetical protein ANN_20586 [Periplaneta americana]
MTSCLASQITRLVPSERLKALVYGTEIPNEVELQQRIENGLKLFGMRVRGKKPKKPHPGQLVPTGDRTGPAGFGVRLANSSATTGVVCQHGKADTSEELRQRITCSCASHSTNVAEHLAHYLQHRTVSSQFTARLSWLVLLAQSFAFTESRTTGLQRRSAELRTQVPQLRTTALELRASSSTVTDTTQVALWSRSWLHCYKRVAY